MSKDEIYILKIVPFLEIIPIPNIYVLEDTGIIDRYFPIEICN